MEKVRPRCGQPSDRGRLKNRTDVLFCSLAVLGPRVGHTVDVHSRMLLQATLVLSLVAILRMSSSKWSLRRGVTVKVACVSIVTFVRPTLNDADVSRTIALP